VRAHTAIVFSSDTTQMSLLDHHSTTGCQPIGSCTPSFGRLDRAASASPGPLLYSQATSGIILLKRADCILPEPKP
jgi:hypothetical protein